MSLFDEDILNILSSDTDEPDFTPSGGGGIVSTYEPTPDVSQWSDYIDTAIAENPSQLGFDINKSFVNRLIEQESGGNPYASSYAGAGGLMQLMPETAESLGVIDVNDPEDNIRGGVKLISILMDKYDGDQKKVLAAYNGGESGVDKATEKYGDQWLAHLDEFKGVDPYTGQNHAVQTWNYIDAIEKDVPSGPVKTFEEDIAGILGIDITPEESPVEEEIPIEETTHPGMTPLEEGEQVTGKKPLTGSSGDFPKKELSFREQRDVVHEEMMDRGEFLSEAQARFKKFKMDLPEWVDPKKMEKEDKFALNYYKQMESMKGGTALLSSFAGGLVPFSEGLKTGVQKKAEKESPIAAGTGKVAGAITAAVMGGSAVNAQLAKIPVIKNSANLMGVIGRTVTAGSVSAGQQDWKKDFGLSMRNTLVSMGAGAVSMIPEIYAPAGVWQLGAQPLADVLYDAAIDKAQGKKVISPDFIKRNWLNWALAEGFAIKDVASGVEFKATQATQRAEISNFINKHGNKGFEVLKKAVAEKPKKAEYFTEGAEGRIKTTVETYREQELGKGVMKPETVSRVPEESEMGTEKIGEKGGFEAFRPTKKGDAEEGVSFYSGSAEVVIDKAKDARLQKQRNELYNTTIDGVPFLGRGDPAKLSDAGRAKYNEVAKKLSPILKEIQKNKRTETQAETEARIEGLSAEQLLKGNNSEMEAQFGATQERGAVLANKMREEGYTEEQIGIVLDDSKRMGQDRGSDQYDRFKEIRKPTKKRGYEDYTKEEIQEAHTSLLRDSERAELSYAEARSRLDSELKEVEFVSELRQNFQKELGFKTTTGDQWQKLIGKKTKDKDGNLIRTDPELEKKLNNIADSYNLIKEEGEGATIANAPPRALLESVDNWQADDVASLIASGMNKGEFSTFKKEWEGLSAKSEEEYEVAFEEMGKRGESISYRMDQLEMNQPKVDESFEVDEFSRQKGFESVAGSVGAGKQYKIDVSKVEGDVSKAQSMFDQQRSVIKDKFGFNSAKFVDRWLSRTVDVNAPVKRRLLKNDDGKKVIMHHDLMRGASGEAQRQYEIAESDIYKTIPHEYEETFADYIQAKRTVEVEGIVYKRDIDKVFDIIKQKAVKKEPLSKQEINYLDMAAKNIVGVERVELESKIKAMSEWASASLEKRALRKYQLTKRDVKLLHEAGNIKSPGGLGAKENQAWLDELKKQNPKVYGNIEKAAKKYYKAIGEDSLNALVKDGLITRGTADDLIKEHPHYSPRNFIQHIDPDTKSLDNQGRIIDVPDSGLKGLAEGSEEALLNNPRLLLGQILIRTQSRIFKNRANKSLLEFANKNPDNALGVTVEKPIGKTKGGKPKYADVPAEMTRIHAMVDGKAEPMLIPTEMAKYWVASDPKINRNLAGFLNIVSGNALLKPMATGYNPGFAISNTPRDLVHSWFTTEEYSPILPVAWAQQAKDMFEVKGDVFKRKGVVNDYIKEGGSMDFLTQQGQLRKRPWETKGPTDEAINQIGKFAGYIGETSELWTRMALRNRAIKNGKSPQEATWVARNYIDFSQGGSWTKAADNVSPYFNAGIQGTRGIVGAFKKNPKLASFKAAQVMGIGFGLAYWAKHVAKECWESISDREKSTKFIIPTNISWKDRDGNKRWLYFPIAKDQGQRIFATIGEELANVAHGGNVNWNKLKMAATDFTPAGISNIPPTFSSLFGYTFNKDFWKNEDIWKGRKGVSPKEEYWNSTPKAWVMFGKATSLSPERSKRAFEKVMPQNFYTYIMGAATNQFFGTLDDKDKSQVSEHFLNKLTEFPILQRMARKTYPISDKMEEELLKKANEYQLDIQKSNGDPIPFNQLKSRVEKAEKDEADLKIQFDRQFRFLSSAALIGNEDSRIELKSEFAKLKDSHPSEYRRVARMVRREYPEALKYLK